MHRCSLNFLYFQAVFLVKSYKNIMVCLREVIDDTVDVGFNILRAMDIQMLVGTDMQCVGDTEMVPEKLVQRGVFVDPYDLIDRYDRIAVDGSFNEKCSVINISSVASCGSVASSSSACSNIFFGLPNSARSWHAGESTGKTCI